MHARPSFEFRSAMFRSALRRARTALQPLVTGARASAPHVERRALSTLCASDLAAAGRVSPVAAVRTALRRDIHHSSLLHDAGSTDASEKGLYQVLGEELEHERSTYVPSEIIAAGPPAPFELIESDGDCEITLVRTYGDDEEISITFNAAEVRAPFRTTHPPFHPPRTRRRSHHHHPTKYPNLTKYPVHNPVNDDRTRTTRTTSP